MSKLKLYHQDTFIGTITNISPEDNYEMSGAIDLSADFEKYRTIFAYLLTDDGQTRGGEPPFDDFYFDGWILEDERGNRTHIDIPSIENDEIIWRE